VESAREEGEICVLHAKDGSLCLRGTEILDILLREKYHVKSNLSLGICYSI